MSGITSCITSENKIILGSSGCKVYFKMLCKHFTCLNPITQILIPLCSSSDFTCDTMKQFKVVHHIFQPTP